MTEAEKSDNRDDCRRAAALVVHNARTDVEGVNAILAEASEAKRIPELIIALLDLYQYLIPELRTDLAIKFMSEAVTRMAVMDVTKR